MEDIPGKHLMDSLQKRAILGTSHIIREVLQCDTWSISVGGPRWFKRCTRNKRPVTRDDDDNLKTELNSKNKVTAINTLAAPVLVLSFGIVN